MEKIRSVLKNPCPIGKFSICVGEEEPFEMPVSIRFIFLEIGAPLQKGVACLSYFAPGIDIENGKVLLLNAATENTTSFSISAENKQNVEIGFQLATNAQISSREFPKSICDYEFNIDQHMIAYFSDSPFPRPCQVHLSDGVFSVYENKELRRSYTINNTLTFQFPDFRTQPQFTLNNVEGKMTFIVPTYQDVEEWYLIFTAIKVKVNKTKSALLSQLSVETIDGVQSESSEEETKEPEVEEREEEEEKAPVEEEKKEKKEKIENNSDEEEDEEEVLEIVNVKTEDSAVESMKKSYLKESDLRKFRYERGIHEMEKVKERLKNKLAHNPYRIRSTHQIDEPHLDFPQKIEHAYKLDELIKDSEDDNDKVKVDFDICNAITEHITNTKINEKRYTGKEVDDSKFTLKTEFNEESPESFIATYKSADKEQTFILQMVLIKSGFSGSSISNAFQVPKRGEDSKIQELATIVEAHKDDLFDYILSNTNNISELYASSAFIKDHSLLRKMKEMKKEIAKPESFPSPLPFQFQHRPVELIKHWIFNALYEVKMSKPNSQLLVYKLSQCLLEFFSHYLVYTNIQTFFKLIASESSQQQLWSTFKKQSDWNIAWVMQWLQAFKDGTLIQCFKDVFENDQMINISYAECSSVRNPEDVNSVINCLNVFVSLGLPTDYEIEKSKDFESFFKGFLRGF